MPSSCFKSETETKKIVVEIVKAVAAKLGNTASVCSKCYIHPAVIDAYLNGGFTKTVRKREDEESLEGGLQWEEMVLMKLMRVALRLKAA
jgi:DNA topoisomerase I